MIIWWSSYALCDLSQCPWLSPRRTQYWYQQGPRTTQYHPYQAPIPHYWYFSSKAHCTSNTTLIEETNNRPTPHSVHRCLHHTVKSTGPILISAGSPPTFLGTSQEKKISKHCWTVNVSWLGYHRESAITQCHQPMRHAAALKNCLKFVMASKVFR